MRSETQPAQQVTLQPNQPRTAMVVIGHRERGLALQRLLSLYGYSLLIATDVDGAFALSDTYCPELLLLDCCLPFGVAATALARIKAEAPLQHIPIIMLDTLPDETAGAVWLACGVAAYVPTLPDSAALETALAALQSASDPRLPLAVQATTGEPAVRSRVVGETAWRPISSTQPLTDRLRAAL